MSPIGSYDYIVQSLPFMVTKTCTSLCCLICVEIFKAISHGPKIVVYIHRKSRFWRQNWGPQVPPSGLLPSQAVQAGCIPIWDLYREPHVGVLFKSNLIHSNMYQDVTIDVTLAHGNIWSIENLEVAVELRQDCGSSTAEGVAWRWISWSCGKIWCVRILYISWVWFY